MSDAKKWANRACQTGSLAVTVAAFLCPARANSLGETPQHIKQYQLHIHSFYLLLTWPDSHPAVAVIHRITSHIPDGNASLSDIPEAETSSKEELLLRSFF